MSTDWIIVSATEPQFGAQVGSVILTVHAADDCMGPPDTNGQPICCIHNPSQHHMATWPQNWRADRLLMERLCPHNIGHPDPDDLSVRRQEYGLVHGCDGCCALPPIP